MSDSQPEVMARGVFVQLLKEGRWEYADRVKGDGAVTIIAVTENDELVLTEQYRIPLKKRVIDLPAGLTGDIEGEENESREIAARRELLEETGFEGDTFERVFAGPLSAGMTTEVVDFYLARGVRRVGEGGGDETEDIQVHVVPLKSIVSWITQRIGPDVCLDPKVFAAIGILNSDVAGLIASGK